MQVSRVDNTMFIPVNGVYGVQNEQGINQNPFGADKVDKAKELSPSGKVECQTCKNRTYVDQSGDAGVSFKAPGHISPEASAAVVSSHEAEHVAIAKAEGGKAGNKLVRASVRLHMSTCPECGRAYVSGGTTTTQISYSDPNQKRGGVNSIDEDLKGVVVDKKI